MVHSWAHSKGAAPTVTWARRTDVWLEEGQHPRRLHNRTNTLRVPRVPADPATRSSHHPSAIPALNGSLPLARDLAALVGPDIKQEARSTLEQGKAVQGFVHNRVRRRRQEGVLGARLLVLDTDQHRA